VQVAGLMGVNINRVIAATFVIGAALGAIAGVMVGTYYGIAHYTMGAMLGLKAFSAAVLGGIGNSPAPCSAGSSSGSSRRSAPATSASSPISARCRGARPAGWMRERCADGGNFVLFGSNYQDVFAFLMLILVLIFRPSGLLGERV
jgi:branched-chain amino acid transport system permease protein